MASKYLIDEELRLLLEESDNDDEVLEESESEDEIVDCETEVQTIY